MLLAGRPAKDGNHADRRDVVFIVLEMTPCSSPAALSEMLQRCSPAALPKMEMTLGCMPAVPTLSSWRWRWRRATRRPPRQGWR